MQLLLWGFHSRGCTGVARRLDSRGHPVSVWVGNHESCTHNIFDLLSLGFLQNPNYSSGDSTILSANHLATFVDMYSRHQKKYQQLVFHDYKNIFHIYLNYLTDLLEQNKIGCVIFSNVPHEGPDYLLYEIAKTLDIQTLIFSQSLFANKYFISRSIDDFGTFSKTPIVSDRSDIRVERKYEKDLFYMNKIDPYRFGIGEAFKDLFTQKLKYNYLAPLKLRRFRQYVFDLNFIPQPEYGEEKYIYFPLHLQPEMTTAALGGYYSDQVTAVEALHRLLPAGWLIYLKENPRQTEFMRGQYFFRRLQSMKRVRMCPVGEDTYKLIRNSRLVATITGTAGWEAITGGKNVILFGNAWYKNLPGAFQFDTDLDLEEISERTIDHIELQDSFSSLQKKMGDGVVDDAYSVLVNGFDENANEEQITSMIIELAG